MRSVPPNGDPLPQQPILRYLGAMPRIHQHRSGLYQVEVELADFGVRGAVIRGDESAMVWDTLSHPRDMAPVAGLLGDQELSVVYSHGDWDHVFGTAGLDQWERTVIGHADCRPRFAEELPRGLRERRREEPDAGWEQVVLVPPEITFDECYTLDLGGLTVELHHLPGHTPDSIVGYVSEWGLLLAGDAVEWPVPTVPAGAPIQCWIDELKRWAGCPGLTDVWPSHGPLGGKERLLDTIAYLDALLGRRPFEVPEEMTPFYSAAHRENRRLVTGGGTRG